MLCAHPVLFAIPASALTCGPSMSRSRPAVRQPLPSPAADGGAGGRRYKCATTVTFAELSAFVRLDSTKQAARAASTTMHRSAARLPEGLTD